MSEMSALFERASRLKVRFETAKGNLTVEDLWDLPLTSRNGNNLDEIAKELHRKVKESAEIESFVKKAVKKDTVTLLKFEVVKYIIDVRLAEEEAAEKRKANADRKAKLLALVAQKENESDLSKSREELLAEIQALAETM